jgi:hypothetical protein
MIYIVAGNVVLCSMLFYVLLGIMLEHFESKWKVLSIHPLMDT